MNASGREVRFGNYLLRRRVAKGGMADVYLATQTGLSGFERPVAIKRILPHLSSDEAFVNMFLTEAKIAAQLSHPNIVQIYELGNEEDSYYIAMEYIEGVNLEHLQYELELRGRRVPYEIAARIMASVCDALFYAHNQCDIGGRPLSIVHRDVTPGNVMITYQGGVKLVDFGIAKATAQLERTRPGIVKGKFYYLSPEQALRKDIDCRADLFSLGVMLYEITTGVRPFDRGTPVEILDAIKSYYPPPPRQVLPEYPPRLSYVVMRAMEKDPDARYHNAREIQVDLESYITQSGHVTGTVEISAFLREVLGPRREAGFADAGDDEDDSPTGPGHGATAKARASRPIGPDVRDATMELRPSEEMAALAEGEDGAHATDISETVKWSRSKLGVATPGEPFNPFTGEFSPSALSDEGGRPIDERMVETVVREQSAAPQDQYGETLVRAPRSPEQADASVDHVDELVPAEAPSPTHVLEPTEQEPKTILEPPEPVVPKTIIRRPSRWGRKLFVTMVLLAGVAGFGAWRLELLPPELRVPYLGRVKLPVRRPAPPAAPTPGTVKSEGAGSGTAETKPETVVATRVETSAEAKPVSSRPENQGDKKPESNPKTPSGATSKENTVRLIVETRPPGATVTRLDTGEVLGQTPLDREVSRGGVVKLKLALIGREVVRPANLSKDAQIRLEMPPAKPVRGAAKPPPPAAGRGRLAVDASPWANVSIDDGSGPRDLGTTPLETEVAPGNYTLTAENPEKGREERKVAVKAGAMHRLRFFDLTGEAAK